MSSYYGPLLRSNIPQTALVATLDIYDFNYTNNQTSKQASKM
jgi:hypothetical protein